jgi:hypothetical protein
MSRIKLTDTTMDALIKMSEGNPGALSAMMELLDKTPKIDPQSALGGIGSILALDTYGIYGSDIYVLWSDKCGRDIRKMCLLLRAVQLGHLHKSRLQEMGADQGHGINLSDEEWSDINAKVCNQLEKFERENSTAA